MGASDISSALPDDQFDALCDLLGHRFRRADLVVDALTHGSFSDQRTYERLEFLGDRVLGLIVAEMLLRRFPDEEEGDLAKRHVALVRQEALAEIAAGLGLGRFIRLARGEEESGGRENPAILSDVMEALLAALYLDGGLEVVRAFIEPHWTPVMETVSTPPKDAKTTLQEWAQRRGLPLPSYREVKREGPPHAPTFTVEVTVKGKRPALGEGTSKRLAEQAAADMLLTVLKVQR